MHLCSTIDFKGDKKLKESRESVLEECQRKWAAYQGVVGTLGLWMGQGSCSRPGPYIKPSLPFVKETC